MMRQDMFYYLFSIAIVIISSPFMVVIAILIAISSGLPIVFTQKRIGKNGQPFTMYKFRTMVVNAEQKKKSLYKYNEASGPVFKIRNDPRFTPIGKWLSHTGLDELPQLVNVLKGNMQLIGPRPLPVLEAQQLKPWQKERQITKPGIISPWVLDGYHKKTFDEWMRSDIAYIHRKSFFFDVQIFFSSVWFMIRLISHECCK
jgi:lipopolysaccharide/colanic/teichoic acid biosynthesis glycosyltransferase